jgi:Mlc titration factor MtfA (ptsG expression regulator)
MVFSLWRNWRRNSAGDKPFPDEWRKILEANAAFYWRLSETQQAKIRRDVLILVADKYWEGCNGFLITEEAKVTIAAQIARLTLGFDGEYFDVAFGKTILDSGVILEGESHRLGEAWYRGPVILSWPETLAAGCEQTEGENLVVHEFAHQLDMQNGRSADGTPPMASREQFEKWKRVVESEFESLVRDCEDRSAARWLSRSPGELDCSAAGNRAEFFAVASERFFTTPREFRDRRPELYEVLAEFYRQDPGE